MMIINKVNREKEESGTGKEEMKKKKRSLYFYMDSTFVFIGQIYAKFYLSNKRGRKRRKKMVSARL